ncbi:MAG: transglutaminase-like cysteine peptidase, partial [Desulfovibrio sp.]|nr:transglutaminase-like cysteine peptidase [Desulfovibrio sp.]
LLGKSLSLGIFLAVLGGGPCLGLEQGPIPGVLPYGTKFDEQAASRPPLSSDSPSLKSRQTLSTPKARPSQAQKQALSPSPAQDAGSLALQPKTSLAGKVLLFKTVEFKRPLNSLPAWLKLLEKNKNNSIFRSGQKFNQNTTWDSFKAACQGKKGLELLRYVHNFWNKWPYREDLLNWGQQDYWATPAEFLKKSGDCEDYAIIKYFTLKELGVPPEKMRIVVLRDTVRNLAHAVLVVYLDQEAYVLDNLSNAVLSHSRFSHYLPQYSVNELGRWAHVKGRPLTAKN